jgi:serine phosphatase RsbU (regulator of sigma subunit)
MGGDLIVAPALLLLITRRPLLDGPGGRAEAVLLALVLGGASAVVFNTHTSFVYLLFPLVIWSALRFLQPGAAAAGLIVGLVAVAFTAAGDGPFATAGRDDRLLLAQTLVAVAESTALVLAAVTSERRRAEAAVSEIAATLQQSLLPDPPPMLDGWESSSLYLPAGVANDVGGDFYDLFRAGAGPVAVIGDVAGKGAKAAALTALARHTIRTAATLLDDPAEGAVRHLNAVLAARSELSLCTIGCVAIDESNGSGVATVVTAGHPQPYLIRDGEPSLIEVHGEPAGAFADIALTPARLELRAGDILVLYTDGVTDAIRAGERFGARRLREALRGARGAGDAVARIGTALAAFQDGAQSDDTAVLAMMRVAR